MKLENYHVKGEEKIVSPALIYYRDAIVKNTQLLNWQGARTGSGIM